MENENENKKTIQVGTKVLTPKHGEGVVVGFSKSIDEAHREYTVVNVQVGEQVRHFGLDEIK